MPSRERDHRGEDAPTAVSQSAQITARPQPIQPIQPTRPPVRHHHFHDVPPWPHQHHHDYVLVEGWGWWPRWYPYWDPGWRTYWWHLYDYYGGDARPEYAEYARDASLRANAPQWGLAL